MKIVFLNIWNCTNRNFAEKFIKESLIDTDVFCFQEAYEKTKWLCKDLLFDYSVYADYRYVSDKDDFPEATYIKKNIDVISNRTLLLDLPSAGLALYTQLIFEGKNFHICNVHGVSKPGDKLDNDVRLQQSEMILTEFKNLDGIKIIGGDFNLDLNSKSVGMFEKSGYRNLIKDYSIPTTRNKYVWDRYPDTKQYYSDYVLVSGDAVVKDFKVPNSDASDHLPLLLTIE